jgi:hypothetical protein
MNCGCLIPGLVGYGSTILLLASILNSAAAQSSSSVAAPSSSFAAPQSSSPLATHQGAGQDCTRDSSICMRGLLCLPSFDKSASDRRVCRQPKENEVCDTAAPCEGSGANGSLACLPRIHMIPHTGMAINFPGRTCVRAVGRGRSCEFGVDCLPGLSCGNTGLLTPACIFSTPQASLGQDCSKADCASNFLCKINTNGSRHCVDLIPEGQPCDLKEYDLSGNPCKQSEYLVACINGTCARGLRPGATCTTPEDPYSSSVGQCDTVPRPIGIDRPKCIKSETGTLKCLVPSSELGPCGDSINVGCAGPDAQCIKGYCGLPNGDQGDLCGPGGACKPGLKCVQSPLSGAGSRCTLQQDAGYLCDPQKIFAICKDGLNCRSYNGYMVCLRGPVPIGGKCVAGETECAPGLTCVANDYPDMGFEGVCMQVSSLGSACNPNAFQVCDQNRFRDPFTRTSLEEVPLMECKDGKCVNSTVGLWSDRCGDNTGRTCAQQDPISKFQLECVPNWCSYVNGSVGHPCSFGDRFASKNYGCATGLYCSEVNHPPAKTNLPGSTSDSDVFKCVQYVLDGERCDYNNLIGCRNRNSSCVHGICTIS